MSWCSPRAAAAAVYRSPTVRFIALFCVAVAAVTTPLVWHHFCVSMAGLRAALPSMSIAVAEALASIPQDLRVTVHANASVEVNRRLPAMIPLKLTSAARTAVVIEPATPVGTPAAAVEATLRAKYGHRADVAAVIAAPFVLLLGGGGGGRLIDAAGAGVAAVEAAAALLCHAYDTERLPAALAEERAAKMEVLQAANGNSATAVALLARARASGPAGADGVSPAPPGLVAALRRLGALPHNNVSTMTALAAQEAAARWPALFPAAAGDVGLLVAAVRMHGWLSRFAARKSQPLLQSPLLASDEPHLVGAVPSPLRARIAGPRGGGGTVDAAVAAAPTAASAASSSAAAVDRLGGAQAPLTSSYVCTRATVAAALDGLFAPPPPPQHKGEQELWEGDVLARMLLALWLVVFAATALATATLSLALRTAATSTALRLVLDCALLWRAAAAAPPVRAGAPIQPPQPASLQQLREQAGVHGFTVARVSLAASTAVHAWVNLAPLAFAPLRAAAVAAASRAGGGAAALLLRGAITAVLAIAGPLCMPGVPLQLAMHAVATAAVAAAAARLLRRRQQLQLQLVGGGAAVDAPELAAAAAGGFGADAVPGASATPNPPAEAALYAAPTHGPASPGVRRRHVRLASKHARLGGCDAAALVGAGEARLGGAVDPTHPEHAAAAVVDQLRVIAELQRHIAETQRALEAQIRALHTAAATRQAAAHYQWGQRL